MGSSAPTGLEIPLGGFPRTASPPPHGRGPVRGDPGDGDFPWANFLRSLRELFSPNQLSGVGFLEFELSQPPNARDLHPTDLDLSVGTRDLGRPFSW